MKRFVEGTDRGQSTLLPDCLEDWICEDNPVRVIDVFVDWLATRSSVVLRCRACKKNTSLTAGTVMQSSHMPLSTWFWGAYLMTTQTPGQSALQFQRQLDIATYETAFAMLHKLRAGMVRPDRDTIGAPHPVEVDECCVGGRTRGEGRGVHHQTTVVGAVEVRTRKDAEARSAKWKDV